MAQSRQIWRSDTGKERVTITYVVHTIKLGDVEDPSLYVAAPIYDWQQTDAGKWVMENSVPSPSWHSNMDILSYSYVYQIRAYLTHQQLTYYKLKFE